jgi:GNAT superfamily N-acetyltransferase
VNVKDAPRTSPSLRRDPHDALILDRLTESIEMTRLDADKFLAVAAPFRCRGIGNRLMERAEEILRAVGCPKINLLVRVGNEPELSRFYAGLGFRLDQVVCYGKRLQADEASFF